MAGRSRIHYPVVTLAGLSYGFAMGELFMLMGAAQSHAVLLAAVVGFSTAALIDVATDAPSEQRSWRLAALGAAALMIPCAVVVIGAAVELVTAFRPG